jgi:flagellar hook assembly protein FlgD
VEYAVPSAGRVRLSIHDLHGRTVRVLRDGTLPAGWHRERWDGADAAGRPVSPGVYHVRLEAAGRVVGRKLVVMR